MGTLHYRLSGFFTKDIGSREIMCPNGLPFSIRVFFLSLLQQSVISFQMDFCHQHVGLLLIQHIFPFHILKIVSPVLNKATKVCPFFLFAAKLFQSIVCKSCLISLPYPLSLISPPLLPLFTGSNSK